MTKPSEDSQNAPPRQADEQPAAAASPLEGVTAKLNELSELAGEKIAAISENIDVDELKGKATEKLAHLQTSATELAAQVSVKLESVADEAATRFDELKAAAAEQYDEMPQKLHELKAEAEETFEELKTEAQEQVAVASQKAKSFWSRLFGK